MRTSFELKFLADTLTEASNLATKEISRFLGIEEKSVPDAVSLELKVSYPKAETVSEIEASVEAQTFQVTAYGSVKQSAARPFGF
jgi:hypothetical protein